MNVNACIDALVSNLHSAHAVVSPGSRNAPLVFALNASGKSCYSVVDERSAGFVALGMAKQLGEPVILCCTSGTAALNYYPAIAEAFYARIPLIVITADRPPEQIDAWDGQAIRQNGVFDAHIRWSAQTPSDYNDASEFVNTANRLNNHWGNGINGPVHLNVPIREPFYNLVPKPAVQAEGRTVSYPVQSISLTELSSFVKHSFEGKKVLIFNGMDDGEGIVVANGNNGVMLSDITSGQTGDVYYWDALLYTRQTNSNGLSDLESLAPDILITTGTTTVSKGLKRFIRHFGVEHHFHLSRFNEIGDMFGTQPVVVNPQQIKHQKDIDTDVDGLRDGPYIAAWLNATQAFEKQFAGLDWTAFGEFSMVNFLINQLPAKAEVHWANSMAVRYASFLVNSDITNNTMYGNRGTSGIDGSTSTAVGHALVVKNPVVLVTGDVAFFYDINALYQNKLPDNLKIVVLNNGGGGIFDMIPGPEAMGEAKHFQTTPHQRTSELLAQHFGAAYFKVSEVGQVEKNVGDFFACTSCAVLEVCTDQKFNVQFFESFKAL